MSLICVNSLKFDAFNEPNSMISSLKRIPCGQVYLFLEKKKLKNRKSRSQEVINLIHTAASAGLPGLTKLTENYFRLVIVC